VTSAARTRVYNCTVLRGRGRGINDETIVCLYTRDESARADPIFYLYTFFFSYIYIYIYLYTHTHTHVCAYNAACSIWRGTHNDRTSSLRPSKVRFANRAKRTNEKSEGRKGRNEHDFSLCNHANYIYIYIYMYVYVYIRYKHDVYNILYTHIHTCMYTYLYR